MFDSYPNTHSNGQPIQCLRMTLKVNKNLMAAILSVFVCSFSLGFSPIVASENAFMSGSSTSGFRPTTPTEPTFLAVEQAFKLDINQSDEQTTLVWTIAPGYYLYKHKFDVSGKTGEDIQALTDQTQFSRGIRKRDDYFGPVEVYYHQATAELSAPKAEQVIVKYQGCADAGLCYPIQTKIMTLQP